MFLRSEKVTVNGFFGAPRCAVVIHPGSWWSGVAHVMFDGDQVVTAVPRKCLAKFDGEDWEKFQKYNTADTDAAKGFQSGGVVPDTRDLFPEYMAKKREARSVPGLKDGEIPAVLSMTIKAGAGKTPRSTVAPAALGAPYGNPEPYLNKYRFVVDATRGRVMVYKSARMVGAHKYYSFEFGNKKLVFPESYVNAMISRFDFYGYKDRKGAKDHLTKLSSEIYPALFRVGTFFTFDGSPRLWMVSAVDGHVMDGLNVELLLCCVDDSVKPYKTMTLDALAHCYKSGHTVRYAGFDDAIKQLSDESPLTYYNPSEDEQE